MTTSWKLTLATLTAVCLTGSATAARVAGQQGPSEAHTAAEKRCLSREELGTALEQASAFLEQARYQEAAGMLRPAAEQKCDARASLLLAAALEGSGNVPGAEEALRQAQSVWPSNTSIDTSLARLYMAGRQVDKASQALAHFKPAASTPQRELELAVVVYLANHELPAAQAVAEVDYNNHPSAHSLVLLGNTLQLQGRFKEVIRILGTERKTYAQSPEFLVTLAESEYDSVLYDTARDDLKRAIQLDPNSYQAHFLLGNVLLKMNDTDAGVAEYRLAAALKPDQPRTYYQIAISLEAKNDQAGEESMLEQALAVDGHYAPAHAEMGRILLSQNHIADAVTQLNLAIQDNPSLEQSYFLLAKAYAQVGEKDKSDAMGKRLVAVRNANWRSLNRKDGAQSAGNSSAVP